MIPQSYILESVASFVSYVYAYTYKYFRSDFGTSFGVARYRRVCRRHVGLSSFLTVHRPMKYSDETSEHVRSTGFAVPEDRDTANSLQY